MEPLTGVPVALKPFIKYLGGKRGMLPFLRPLYPKTYNKYFEPFLGGGAVLFDLQPKEAIISDLQKDLIDTYKTIRDDLPGLLDLLREHHHRNYETNQSDPGTYFYSVRAWDRLPGYEDKEDLERAARLVFINRTGFNGLMRQNSKGQSNVPWGKGMEKYEIDESCLSDVSNYLKSNQVEILCQDGVDVLNQSAGGDLCFLDPPYIPVSETSSFTTFSKGGFSMADQVRLRNAIDEATDRGVKIIYTNSDTQIVRDLFKDVKYTVLPVMMRRAINSDASKRGKVGEVVILNYIP